MRLSTWSDSIHATAWNHCLTTIFIWRMWALASTHSASATTAMRQARCGKTVQVAVVVAYSLRVRVRAGVGLELCRWACISAAASACNNMPAL